VVRDGKVVPEVAEVIAIPPPENNLVLETGHSSGSEDLVIIEEGPSDRGVAENVVVTHGADQPPAVPSRYPRFQQSREARRVLFELVLWWAFSADLLAQGRRCDPRWSERPSVVAGKRPGVKPNNPLHTDGLLAFYKGLMALGISEADNRADVPDQSGEAAGG